MEAQHTTPVIRTVHYVELPSGRISVKVNGRLAGLANTQAEAEEIARRRLAAD